MFQRTRNPALWLGAVCATNVKHLTKVAKNRKGVNNFYLEIGLANGVRVSYLPGFKLGNISKPQGCIGRLVIWV